MDNGTLWAIFGTFVNLSVLDDGLFNADIDTVSRPLLFEMLYPKPLENRVLCTAATHCGKTEVESGIDIFLIVEEVSIVVVLSGD